MLSNVILFELRSTKNGCSVLRQSLCFVSVDRDEQRENQLFATNLNEVGDNFLGEPTGRLEPQTHVIVCVTYCKNDESYAEHSFRNIHRWPSWIRTNTHRTKICSPAIRRWANVSFQKRSAKINISQTFATEIKNLCFRPWDAPVCKCFSVYQWCCGCKPG